MDLAVETVEPRTTKAVIQDAARAVAIAAAGIRRAAVTIKRPVAKITVVNKGNRTADINSPVAKLPPNVDTASLPAIKGTARDTDKAAAIATANMATAKKAAGNPVAAKFQQFRTATVDALTGTVVAVARRKVARRTTTVVAPIKAVKATWDARKRADTARKRRHASKIFLATRWLTVSVVWAVVWDDS